MACVCGIRHLVVFMTFVGMLLTIGSRSVFTMVIAHVMGSQSSSEGLIHMTCLNTSAKYMHTDWPASDAYNFQTAYFAGYIVTQLPGGILAARFSPRRVCGVCALVTSLLVIALKFALHYQPWLVYLIRVLQGLVEGPIIPSFNGMVASWAPKSEKSVMITISYAGAYLSAAVANILSGILICKLSWPGAALIVYGCAGVVWSIVWLCALYDSPSGCPCVGEREKALFNKDDHHSRPGAGVKFSEIPWRKILTSLPLSAIVVAAFCRNWIFALLVTQIPLFYKNVYDMSPDNIGLWSALPHVMMTVVVIAGGFVVDALIKHKVLSTTAARKTAETLGFGVESVCFLVLGLVPGLSPTHAIVVICVGVAVSGFAISGYQPNPLDIAPRYCSVLTGIVRLGTIGAVISAAIAGKVASGHTWNDWRTIFIVAGSLHLAGVIYYLIFASGNRQPWAEEDQTLLVRRNQPLTHAASYNSLPASIAYDSDDEKESLLTKSLRVEQMAYDSDEFEGASWFMNTI